MAKRLELNSHSKKKIKKIVSVEKSQSKQHNNKPQHSSCKSQQSKAQRNCPGYCLA